MNWLFWHSSDVFIQAHIETIYKLKKSLFRNKYMSLISIQQWWHYLSGKHYALYGRRKSAGRITSTSDWYKDCIWRSQRGHCCTQSISTSTLPVPSAVFLLTGNVGAATGRLVTSLYRTVSPRKAVSSPQGWGYWHIHFQK